MSALYPPRATGLAAYREEMRDIPTRDLLHDLEFYRWELADLDDDPFATSKEQSLSYLHFKLSEIEREIERRQKLTPNHFAPAWPAEPASERERWEEIKERVDLRETIEQMGGVSWVSGGTILRARCPFPWHDDSTPSFTLYPDHWFCYGCNIGGSVIDFVAAIHGCEPRAAVNLLAELLPPAIIVHRREET